jgi:formylmethanofuran dehydrogenase subunit E
MNYPEFYDRVETITLFDPLSKVLGSFENGIITFEYKEIVKAAGHSCPTVAGAYLMTVRALEALYGEDIPVRGEVKVYFKEDEKEGVAGVIGNVIANITGATVNTGFKGLGGNFARNGLMFYNSAIDSSAKFLRVDTLESVDLYYNPSIVPADPKMQPLMQKVMQGIATSEEANEFGILWQNRVEKILCEHNMDERVIKVVKL